MNDLPKFYTRKEIAEMLKVGVRTIERWEREGKIKGIKINKSSYRGSNTIRYSEEEVQRLLK